MPSDERPLSERLSEYVEHCDKAGSTGIMVEVEDLHEAARIVALYEAPQPEVAELLRRAEELKSPPYATDSCEQWAADLEAHAACLTAKLAAEAKLAAVRALPEKWRGSKLLGTAPADVHSAYEGGRIHCARELAAALGDEPPSEVVS
jgi:hypothetical protein